MTAGAALVLASLLAQDPTAPPPGGSAAPGVTLS
jgi:hypothetical protein